MEELSPMEFYKSRYGEMQMNPKFGNSPAILVVDLIRGFTDLESPMGMEMSKEIHVTNKIIDAAREANVPVIFVTMAYVEGTKEMGLWLEKIPRNNILVEGTKWVDFDPSLHKSPRDLVITKKYPSAFLGTSLAKSLSFQKIDTVIVTGCTASSCVRATAIDSMCHGFRTIVVVDAVGEFNDPLRQISFMDLGSRNVDLANSEQVIKHLNS